MCRAVWVIVAASSEEDGKRLRKAVGLDCQVVAMTIGSDDLLHAIATGTKADAIVIDGRMGNGEQLVAALRERAPQIATVWVGEGTPGGAHHAIALNEQIDDTLPGAITKALIARRA